MRQSSLLRRQLVGWFLSGSLCSSVAYVCITSYNEHGADRRPLVSLTAPSLVSSAFAVWAAHLLLLPFLLPLAALWIVAARRFVTLERSILVRLTMLVVYASVSATGMVWLMAAAVHALQHDILTLSVADDLGMIARLVWPMAIAFALLPRIVVPKLRVSLVG